MENIIFFSYFSCPPRFSISSGCRLDNIDASEAPNGSFESICPIFFSKHTWKLSIPFKFCVLALSEVSWSKMSVLNHFFGENNYFGPISTICLECCLTFEMIKRKNHFFSSSEASDFWGLLRTDLRLCHKAGFSKIDISPWQKCV